MNGKLRFLIVAALAVGTGACSSLKDNLGLEKKAPDEFAVVRNAPLSLPPDYNLRPPKPGEVGEGRLEQRDQARGLLVGDGGARARTSAAAALTASRPVASPVSYSFVAGRADGPIGELDETPIAGGRVASATATRGGGRGEQALLAHLNATDADPDIRRRVDQEAKVLAADDRNFVEQLMFWRKLNPPGVVVEPAGERRRLNENAALGQPVTEGETPEIRVERLTSGFTGIKLF